ncbi:hypothetical protein L9F63_008093, partial [Diploptera punctata]
EGQNAVMTSVVTELPVSYDPPSSPMNSIGEGATPLMYACQQAREQEVSRILSKKPSAVRERDRTMKTALHYCAENASIACADIIIAAAPDLVDVRDEDGYTPLHLAVIAGNRQLIKFLLAKNADVNCLDYERHSVVHWATVCGEVEALELVLDAGANPSTPDIHGGYPIHYAAQMCGPNSEMGNDVRFGLAVLRKLLGRGVDVNVRDKDGRQPILWAASAGSADAILALVNAGANVEADDKDGLTALHCAASRGHTDCLETLVTLCGAEVDVIDSNGCTALFYSVTLGHADSTQLLLSFGAEPNRQDRKGRTPAHCGAAKGQLETLRILGVHGANLWVRNVRGDYPLHEAVVSGRKDLVRWLLNQRPDAVNSPNNDGRCPLHIAAINNNVEMCKILLDGQALLNPVMRTSKGHLMTPIDAALHRGNRGCAKYLQLHGGVPASKLTDKAAKIRGSNQRFPPKRGAISETQSEYTTPEFAATLSLPGGHTSLGASPLGDQETARRMDSRTLQVRLNDDVAIRHVERIEAPVICTHRRYDDESSGEERMRRRRRRRRREHYVTDIEEDSRRRRRGRRSDSTDSEVRKRRRKRHDEEEYSDSGSERRTRRRWRGRRHSSDELEESGISRDSNWIRNKKRRSEKIKRRSKSKDVSDEGSDVEYIRVRRTVKSKKTKRKTVTDEEEEEEETQIEEDSEEETEEEEDIEDEIEDNIEEVTTKKTTSKSETSTAISKSKVKSNDTEKSKSNEEQKIVTKEPRKSIKKEVSTEKDKKKQKSTGSRKAEIEQKETEKSKSRSKINKKTYTKEKSTLKKTVEEKNKDGVTKSTKKTVKKGMKKIETGETPVLLDKLIEQVTVEEKSIDGEDDVTQTVVTAEVHHQEDDVKMEDQEKEGSSETKTAEESSKEETENPSEEKKEADDKGVQTKPEEAEMESERGLEEEKDNDAVESTTKKEEMSHESQQSDMHQEEGENAKLEDGETSKPEEETNESKPEDEKEITKSREEEEDIDKEETENKENYEGKEVTEIHEDKTEDEKDQFKVEQEENGEKPETEKENEDFEEEKVDKIEANTEENEVKTEDQIMEESKTKEENYEEKPEEEEERSVEKSEEKPVLEGEGEGEADSQTDDKARSEQVEGPPTDDEAQELEHDNSGFEPSPRRDKSSTTSSKQQARSARGVSRGGRGRGRIPRPCRTDDEQPLTTVSVTQAVQNSMRKYHLERRIFQELLELKRLQIRAGRANEQVLVKRLVDDYHKAGLTVGMRQYDGVYTFRNFEKYLYDQLRLLQSSDRRLIPRLKSSDDLEKLTAALKRARFNSAYMDDVPDNPILCTHGTHRCHHAAHAYTGVPCAAYITKLNHHHAPKSGVPRTAGQARGFLPRIDSSSSTRAQSSSKVPHPLRYVDPARPVTLELSHGSDKQVISLPTERLDRNKRYYVTFTIKGGSKEEQKSEGQANEEDQKELRHRHAKSL